MDNLFQLENFKSHSGEILPWKIDCDALTMEDWSCLAEMIFDRVGKFINVEGVPRGGLTLANHLMLYAYVPGPLLIVDDVLTTGESMERHRNGRDAIGAVVFARGPCPSWVTPIFQMGVET